MPNEDVAVDPDEGIQFKVRPRQTGKFETNEKALAAWLDTKPMTVGLKPQTKQHYDQQVGKYLRSLSRNGIHHVDMNPDAFTDYMEQRSLQCRFFRQAIPGVILAPGCMAEPPHKIRANLSNCGKGKCPDWEPTSLTRQENHHQALQRFHEWLVEGDRMEYNWLTEWRNRWYRQNPRRRTTDPNILRPSEIARLVDTEHLVRRAAYVMMYRTGMRWHEIVKLRIDKKHWRPDEGWGEIPSEGEAEGKRQGSHMFFIDTETKYWLEPWLRERAKIAKPSCKTLLVGNHGGRLDMDAGRANARWLADDCKNLRIERPASEPTIKTHAFRRGFSDVLRRNAQDFGTAKADDLWHLLRGDRVNKLVEAYTMTHRAELVDYYKRYAPSIFAARSAGQRGNS